MIREERLAEMDGLLPSSPDDRSGAPTGYDVLGQWETSTRVLHPMYENPEAPEELSHADLRSGAIRAGKMQPALIGGVDLDERTTTTGVTLGRSDAPGPPWRRLRWSELAAREDQPLALGEIGSLYDHADVTGSPSNIWPEDRSWVVWTDHDLWGTRVRGSASLIQALERDSELETIRYP